MSNGETTQLINQSDVSPRSEPALELYSRAASSVGVMNHSSGPNTGSNSEGGRILKKTLGLIRSNYLPKVGIKIFSENIVYYFICNDFHCLFPQKDQ